MASQDESPKLELSDEDKEYLKTFPYLSTTLHGPTYNVVTDYYIGGRIVSRKVPNGNYIPRMFVCP